MKVVVARGDGRRYALVVHLARAVYVFAQALVNVSLLTTSFDLIFVVEFYLGDEKTCEASRVVVQTALVVAVDFNGKFHSVGSPAIATRPAERRGELTLRGDFWLSGLRGRFSCCRWLSRS